MVGLPGPVRRGGRGARTSAGGPRSGQRARLVSRQAWRIGGDAVPLKPVEKLAAVGGLGRQSFALVRPPKAADAEPQEERHHSQTDP